MSPFLESVFVGNYGIETDCRSFYLELSGLVAYNLPYAIKCNANAS